VSKLLTTHDWISSVEQLSTAIKVFDLKKVVPKANLETDAFNFANDPAHLQTIASAFQNISNYAGYRTNAIKQLGAQLFGRQTGGAFGELFVYDWLVRAGLQAEMQIQLPARDVLCGNGSELDGVFDLYGSQIYFDIKSFGMTQKVVETLKSKLEDQLPGMTVHIEESWDLPIKTFQDMIAKAPLIATTLKEINLYREGLVSIRAEPKKPVSISSRTSDPYLLAQENATYPLRYAHKFTRNEPFILIFVIHPWLGGLDLSHNFANGTSIFTRSLARRAFLQFRTDVRPIRTLASQVLDSTTIANSSCLLSGLLFLNSWPQDTNNELSSWFYANPLAKHSINMRHLYSALQESQVQLPSIEGFQHDIY
jgi:hypothetical protein